MPTCISRSQIDQKPGAVRSGKFITHDGRAIVRHVDQMTGGRP